MKYLNAGNLFLFALLTAALLAAGYLCGAESPAVEAVATLGGALAAVLAFHNPNRPEVS